MGYGIIELKCPNGHLWNIEWCSVGGYRQGPTKCSICGEQGQNTQRNVLGELMKQTEKLAKEAENK